MSNKLKALAKAALVICGVVATAFAVATGAEV